MYIIAVYDIADPKRLAKMLGFCRKFLFHCQKSVFEGELSPEQLKRFTDGIKGIIKPKEDSVVVFQLRNEKVMKRKSWGKDEGRPVNMVF